MSRDAKQTENKTVMIQPDSHKCAQLAANLKNQTLVEFLSEAARKAADPVLKKHGIDPAKLEAA